METFWQPLNTNDFRAVDTLLAGNYRLEHPQSGEAVRGRDNFVAVNQKYPANGPWRFTVHRIVAEVVSDVSVTAGLVEARAITFSAVENEHTNILVKQLEFRPDPFEAPWRCAWVGRV